MEGRKNCNNCDKGYCSMARRPLTIILEKAGRLSCYIKPKTKHFKFPELISKVTIKNPNNPAIQFILTIS